ncbi:MAG: protein O-mannosyl-transferase family [bacterium]
MRDRIESRGWVAGVVPAAIAGAAALALYARTLAPTVTLTDSGALILAAHELGVAHPPGFPTYTLLARLATLLPFGGVAARVNFASAIFAALAAGVAVLVAAEAIAAARAGDRWGRHARQHASGDARAGAPASGRSRTRALAAVSALAAGLALATSRTLWNYATVAEVYALNILAMLATLLIVLRWRAQRGAPLAAASDSAAATAEAREPSVQSAARAATRNPRLLILAGFVFGLALGVHHATAALIVPSIALLIATRPHRAGRVAHNADDRLAPRTLIAAAIAALAGLSIYAYLPIAAARLPVLDWGDPRTLERFWWHVSGWQYRFQLGASGVAFSQELRAFVALVAREFGPAWFPAVPLLALAGLFVLWRADRGLAAALALLVAANVACTLVYHVKEDRDAYFLPTFAALAIAAAVGLDALMRRARNAIVVAAAILVAAPALVAHFPLRDRSRDTIARDYDMNTLASVAPNGVVITGDWHLYSSLLYTQKVEGVRPDVTVIDFTQLWRTWYVEALLRASPAVVAPARAELDAFFAEMRVWERGPAAYDADPMRRGAIDARFHEFMLAFVRAHARGGAVYITTDVATKFGGPIANLIKAIASEFAFVPEGLTLQITPDREFRADANATPPLALESLVNARAARRDPESVVAQTIVPAYVGAFGMRATYLAGHGAFDAALATVDRALALAPADPQSLKMRAQIETARAANR